MTDKNGFPFRLGTTSYIIPDEILPNVEYLARQVDDVELVLFDIDRGPSNLPTAADIEKLQSLARIHQLTYTVHLPMDLRLGEDGTDQHISLVKARKVIECTLALQPRAYVGHLDGREVLGSQDEAKLHLWEVKALHALELTASWVGDLGRLAAENLEGYPPDLWDPVFERSQCGRCVDIGHLWLDGHDPLPYLAKALTRTRVIHIHGINGRDHSSLEHVPTDQLKAVIEALCRWAYKGVVTIEVFSQEDFSGSLNALNGVRNTLHL